MTTARRRRGAWSAAFGAALVMLLVVSAAACTSDPSPARTAPVATPAGTSPAAATTSSGPGPTRPVNQATADGEQVARSGAAAAAAAAFMRAFARPDLPQAQWWARVSPLLTASGREAAWGTDPARVPVTAVTGTAVVLPGAEQEARTVTVPTDIGDYTLFLLYEASTSRWLVQTYQPPPDVK